MLVFGCSSLPMALRHHERIPPGSWRAGGGAGAGLSSGTVWGWGFAGGRVGRAVSALGAAAPPFAGGLGSAGRGLAAGTTPSGAGAGAGISPGSAGDSSGIVALEERRFRFGLGVGVGVGVASVAEVTGAAASVAEVA
jgi:hypothetical protein